VSNKIELNKIIQYLVSSILLSILILTWINILSLTFLDVEKGYLIILLPILASFLCIQFLELKINGKFNSLKARLLIDFFGAIFFYFLFFWVLNISNVFYKVGYKSNLIFLVVALFLSGEIICSSVIYLIKKKINQK